MPLLYIDVLGMKARWQGGNLGTVKAAFARLEDLVQQSLAQLPTDTQYDARLQSDAAAILFADASPAIRVGRSIFQAAAGTSTETERFWLRGLITSAPAELYSLETVSDYGAPFRCLRIRHFADQLLSAVLIEQSGPKGARLLLEQELVSQHLKSEFAIDVAPGRLYPFRRLDNSAYPRVEADAFCDVLWMFPDPYTPNSWRDRQRRMNNMLRWAGGVAAATGHDEEFSHAAATALVFTECDAILGSVQRAAVTRASRKASRS